MLLGCRRPLRIQRTTRAISNESKKRIEGIKNPQRGGKDLSQRVYRLENSLRAKEARIGGSIAQVPVADGVRANLEVPVEMCCGLVIPQKPKEPGEEGEPHKLSTTYMQTNSCGRLLHVRMRDMRLRSIRILARRVPHRTIRHPNPTLPPTRPRILMA